MSWITPDYFALNAAPDDLRPYSAILTIMMVPSSDPNSGPALVQIVSLHNAVRYAFWISHARMSRSFNAEIVREILTESLETTD